MTIKLIAVDMDGTFLDDNKEYNQERFSKQYQQLKERGIRFVVASGNQYAQLKSFFPEIASEIAFVAENGAYVVVEDEDLAVGELSKEKVSRVLDVLEEFSGADVIVCGRNSAYVTQQLSEESFNYAKMYYHKLARVDDLHQIDDTLFKFALSVPVEAVAEVLSELHAHLGDIVTPVSSGHGDIDLIIPGLHKAKGISLLQEKWQIQPEEIVAFGDSGNDIEMLQHVGYGYAMANASEAVKAVTELRTDSNNEEGVLNVIDQILVG